MSLELTPNVLTTGIQEIPAADLLADARARLQRQKQYRRVLERGGNRAKGMMDWLDRAADCISALANPTISIQPVETVLQNTGVLIEGQVLLEDPQLVQDISSGGSVTAYLVTLGYSQDAAFNWLDCDYGAQHIQSDLSNEVLFLLGRHAHRMQKDAAAGAHLKRISVQVSDLCGAQKLWDPAKVQQLLSVFGDANPGVSVTDTGCFQPLSTLLGLTVRL